MAVSTIKKELSYFDLGSKSGSGDAFNAIPVTNTPVVGKYSVGGSPRFFIGLRDSENSGAMILINPYDNYIYKIVGTNGTTVSKQFNPVA